MWPNPGFTADLITFTEEILNGKLHCLCSANQSSQLVFTCSTSTMKIPEQCLKSIQSQQKDTRIMSHIRGGSRAAAISKMERFVIIVSGFQQLTIITKLFILDAAAALDPLLHICYGFPIINSEQVNTGWDLLSEKFFIMTKFLIIFQKVCNKELLEKL